MDIDARYGIFYGNSDKYVREDKIYILEHLYVIKVLYDRGFDISEAGRYLDSLLLKELLFSLYGKQNLEDKIIVPELDFIPQKYMDMDEEDAETPEETERLFAVARYTIRTQLIVKLRIPDLIKLNGYLPAAEYTRLLNILKGVSTPPRDIELINNEFEFFHPCDLIEWVDWLLEPVDNRAAITGVEMKLIDFNPDDPFFEEYPLDDSRYLHAFLKFYDSLQEYKEKYLPKSRSDAV